MNKQAFALAAALAAQLVLGQSLRAQPEEAVSLSALAVDVRPEKASYVLGEVVGVRIRITNVSDAAVTFPREATVEDGLLRVAVAAPGGHFREYVGPGWGLADVVGGRGIVLAPGSSVETRATLLFNHRQATGHLSPLYAEALAARSVDPGYAFLQPGTYRLRAFLGDAESGGPVESQPVAVRIVAPRGRDLAVWNVLKTDPELAFFLQTGSTMGHPLAPAGHRVRRTLEQLAAAYPESSYAPALGASLAADQAALRRIAAAGSE